MDEQTFEALQNAAGIDRKGDWGFGITRPPVVAGRGSVRRLRHRIVAFLREMPDHMTVSDLIEELDD